MNGPRRLPLEVIPYFWYQLLTTLVVLSSRVSVCAYIYIYIYLCMYAYACMHTYIHILIIVIFLFLCFLVLPVSSRILVMVSRTITCCSLNTYRTTTVVLISSIYLLSFHFFWNTTFRIIVLYSLVLFQILKVWRYIILFLCFHSLHGCSVESDINTFVQCFVVEH